MLTNSTDWPALEAKAKSLLRQLAQELADTPIYFVDATQLTGLTVGFSAFTSPVNDLVFRNFISDAEWRGRGICIAYYPRNLWLAAEDEADLAFNWMALCVHEIGHALHGEYATQLHDTDQKDVDRLRECYADFLSTPVATLSEAGLQDFRDWIWTTHPADYVRVVCHLWYRASKLGMGIPMTALFRGHNLSSTCYSHALADAGELERMAAWTFAEIMAAPLPAAFRDLWTLDCQRQHALSHPTPEKRKDPMSIVEKLLDKLTGKVNARARTRAANFKELAATIVGGKEPHVEDVERILLDSGKTADDLAAEVKRVLRRRELVEVLTVGKCVEAQRVEVRKAIDQADQQLAQAHDKREATVDPLITRLRALDQLERDAKLAAAELSGELADPDLSDQLERLNQQASALAANRSKIVQRLRDADDAHTCRVNDIMREGKTSHEHSRFATDAQRTADLAALAARTPPGSAPNLKQEIANVDVRMMEIEAEMASVRQKMLEA